MKEEANVTDLNRIKLEEGIFVKNRKKRIYKPNKNYSFSLIKSIENKNKQQINPSWGGYIKLKKKTVKR